MNQPAPPSAFANISLDDKYVLQRGRVYMSAVQALVRLPMIQRQRDLAQGLNTAGFISGYRGSPLGGLDQALWAANKHLESNHIKFQPGLNEDLAATSVWGSQQVNINPAKYDGVFAMWYGKAPGVDRSMDAVRHGNAAGTSQYGGVLMAVGDDHGAKSSTLPGASETILASAMVPILYPSSVQEYLDLGLHGWAMSRFSGLWVALKCVNETVESAASISLDPDRVQPKLPRDYVPPAFGLHIRWPDAPLEQEARLVNHKLPAALAYARANGLDKVVIDCPNARLGIATSGKAYLDVRQALESIGLDDQAAAKLGLRLYKIGMVWPLEREGALRFAQGLDEILVVEEKRSLIEAQLKDVLYNAPGGVRPRIVGKFDENGQPTSPNGRWLLNSQNELTPIMVARALMSRLQCIHSEEVLSPYLARLPNDETLSGPGRAVAERIPYFCSGCPHNTSTNVPEGSRALGGIGCHAMVTWMNRRTQTIVQMGGEGVPWIGQAPFSKEKHVFANLGDGTYFHSGLMAIRAAVAAKVSLTYKILFNDAVAMTGGQPIDGQLTVPQVTRQLAAEGVERIVVVTDEADKYGGTADFAPGVTVRHRDDLDTIQRELREYPHVSALIYDQTCAAEKRRRRKRSTYPDPPRRVVINDLVCEGCGDCSVKSNCLSVEPLETEFGRKRTINQSSCNKDFSCVKGFCPSFVTVEGGRLRNPELVSTGQTAFDDIPLPRIPDIELTFNVIVTGVGGTGVITMGALLGVASHLEGRGISVMDMTGLAQKGGAATSHVRIGQRSESIYATRVGFAEADLVIGCDVLTSASKDLLARMAKNRTRVLINTAQVPTAEFVMNPDWRFPSASAENDILNAIGGSAAHDNAAFVDARALVAPLLGDTIYANPFLLGFAWQKGWIPLSLQALDKAIELNGVSVKANRNAFLWGRRAAHDPKKVARIAGGTASSSPDGDIATKLVDIVERRAAYLAAYQNEAYATRYRRLVDRVKKSEAQATGTSVLTTAVARYYFKLLAYKDEYEVARLYTETSFLDSLKDKFEDGYSLRFHFAPPIFSTPAAACAGVPVKKVFGPWILHVLRILAKLRFLRGTGLDFFGHTAERRSERALIEEYEGVIDELLARLDRHNLPLISEIASVPEEIRGYGHVKERHLLAARQKQAVLLARLRGDVDAATAEPTEGRVALSGG
jgi:indolepyruvate ferredoxin oxidoreductase